MTRKVRAGSLPPTEFENDPLSQDDLDYRASFWRSFVKWYAVVATCAVAAYFIIF